MGNRPPSPPPHHTYHVPGNRASSKNHWYQVCVWCDLEAPLPGTNICDPSLQVYIGYQLGSQVVPCNGVSNVSLHYMVVSVIPVSNVISGRMGSQSHSYLILPDTTLCTRYWVHIFPSLPTVLSYDPIPTSISCEQLEPKDTSKRPL